MMENENEEPKKIEVVTGDGDLTISPVYEHLEVEKPRRKEDRQIIIPEVKENVTRKEEENKEEDDEEEKKDKEAN